MQKKEDFAKYTELKKNMQYFIEKNAKIQQKRLNFENTRGIYPRA